MVLTKEILTELREDEGEPEDRNGGRRMDGEDDADGEDEDMES